MGRYILKNERTLQEMYCPDCHESYKIVERTYEDKELGFNGKHPVINNSVRTGCRCTPELDQFKDAQVEPPTIDLIRWKEREIDKKGRLH